MAYGRNPTLPNLIIIGARKAGTTSLHHYLSLHPQIFMSKRKELSFFDDRIRWRMGIDWYKANFNAAYPINGETSPQYARYPRTSGVPERIKQVLGTPKLIYAIRDPVDRILSDYPQMVEWRPSTPSFHDILPNIESEGEQYIECSSYFFQLSQYMKLFPRENLHFVILERLKAEPRSTLQEVFRFLGVDDQFWSPEFARRLNTAESKRFVAPWFEWLAPQFLKSQVRQVTWMPARVAPLVRRLAQLGGEPIRKPRISREDDRMLQGLLSADVKTLRDFLADPLPEWRPYL